MEHPVKEIAGVISSLTTGSPQEQESALNTYFLRDASFSHPFCRVPGFPKGTIPLASQVDSLWVILGIYRWYRTLSPRIDIHVDSAVFDQRTNQLYVSLRQTFALWFVPFHRAPVRLVTVLQLVQRTSWNSNETVARSTLTEGREPAALAGPGQGRAKYFIASQNDYYALDDSISFVFSLPGKVIVYLWQLQNTLLSVIGSLLLLPLYLLLNRGAVKKTA